MNVIRWMLILMAMLLGRAAIHAQAPASTTASTSSERHFDMVKVGELAFTNVWVHRQTNFNILIRHNGGIHTIKLTDLPENELAELKSQIGDMATVDQSSGKRAAGGLLEKLQAALTNMSPRTLVMGASAAVLLVGLIIVVCRRARANPQ